MNLIIYLIFYSLFIFSIIGYGYFFNNYFLDRNRINLGYCGLNGIFLLTLISYLSNFFVSQNIVFNSLVHTLGIIFFIYFSYKTLEFKKKYFIIMLIIFFLLVFFILSAKPHDDFQYYHFPYIHLLTLDSTSIGIGNFNHGFRTHSSIFYLSSLFFLPVIEYDLVHIAPVFFLGFVNFVFLKKILDIFEKKNNNTYIIFLSLLNLILINIFFYRLGEHGTDRSAQILVLLAITELLFFLNNKEFDNYSINRMLVLIFLIVSLKAFYLIYLIFVIPILYYEKDKYKFLLNLFKNKIFYLCLLFFSFVLFTNFINTGCFIYPLVITCSENLIWSIPKEEVEIMNQWYQLWSKGGASPNFTVENKELYIQNFYWLKNWLDIYFFNKVSDYLCGLIFIVIIFIIIFKRKNNNLNSQNKRKYLFTYLLIIFLLFEWFFNHPALRYGGYHLISLVIFIPLSFHLEKNILINKNFKKKVTFLLLIICLIFVTRNLMRISKEYTVYNYNILTNPSYNEKFKNFDIYLGISEAKKCKFVSDKCKNGSIKSKLLFKKNIFYK